MTAQSQCETNQRTYEKAVDKNEMKVVSGRKVNGYGL
jgi:hypothetical protein